MNVMIELVKILYDKDRLLPIDEDFYYQVLQDLAKDDISSQVFFLLKQQGRLNQTPPFFQDRLKESFEKGLFQNLLIKNQTDLLLRSFEEQGIDVIPLKGVYFSEQYFGHLGARPTSDIDLLILLKDLDKGIECVKSLGFCVEEENIPGHFHVSFSKELPYSTIPLSVEIHWNIVKENTSLFDINDLWKQSISMKGFSHIQQLPPLYTFYMICLHGWRHNLNSMKYFIDIIQLIYKLRFDVDYAHLLAMATKHLTYRRMIRTLSIVYQEFPRLHIISEFPYQKKNLIWKQKREKKINRCLDFIDYQFLSYDSIKHSLVEIVNWIYPSKIEIYNELGVKLQGNYFKLLCVIYKKRITSLVMAFFSLHEQKHHESTK